MVCLFLLVIACGREDDSAGGVADTDTDTDTDSDTDSDSDSDADSDSDTDIHNPLDADGDGYETDVDCDDGDAAIHPDAKETCGNGRDDNCNGTSDGCDWSGEKLLIGITLSTDERDAEAGYATAICDANGDGQADLVMSAPLADAVGAVYVFYGPVVANRNVEEADYTLEGVAPLAGWSLDCRGDIDGDGAADLIIGEQGDWGGSSPGTAYLVPGGGTGTAPLDDAASSAWTGIEVNDHLGRGVVALDESGDGIDDIAVTAWGTPHTPTDAGATYIIDDPPTGTRSIDTATASFSGSSDAWLNPSIGNAGDLDGDGAEELVIQGADGGTPSAVFIFRGPLTGAISRDDADVEIDDTVNCLGELGPMMGHADLDMDGTDDFFVGNYQYDDGDHTGASYVFFGDIVAYTNVVDADLRLYGSEPVEYSGTAIASAGDVDGDGMDDLVIGAENLGGGAGNGGAYLFYGAPAGVYELGTDAQASWQGTASEGFAGSDVAVGDVTGDGVRDFAVSAINAGDGGRVTVVPAFDL